MADEITGTHSQKIDKLIALVVELRTTLRMVQAIVALLTPTILALTAYVLSNVININSDVKEIRYHLSEIDKRNGQVTVINPTGPTVPQQTTQHDLMDEVELLKKQIESLKNEMKAKTKTPIPMPGPKTIPDFEEK
jgi:hypothetical protein